jgi:hypothetical protein
MTTTVLACQHHMCLAQVAFWATDFFIDAGFVPILQMAEGFPNPQLCTSYTEQDAAASFGSRGAMLACLLLVMYRGRV